MSTFLTSYSVWPFGQYQPPWVDPDPQPPMENNPIPEQKNFFRRDDYDGKFLFLTPFDMLVQYPGGTQIGEWSNDGVSAGAVHSDYAEFIRPFGNEAGKASDIQDFSHFSGHRQRAMQEVAAVDTLSEYPVDNQPFKIKLTRTNITDDGWPHIPWGFQARLTFADPNRQPDSYSIGVYSDPECTAYLWTPGAWIWTDTGEVDEYLNPIFAWIIDCPIGQRTATREDWNICNLLGSDQQGMYSMLANQDEFERLFWEESIYG